MKTTSNKNTHFQLLSKLLLFGLAFGLSYQAFATTRYVKPVASGTSWANASADLQGMIDAAGVDTVWVAAGTYTPTTCSPCIPADRVISFIMKNGVAIYGGFDGTETMLSERDWAVNVCILSGDLLGDDGPNFANNTENSYHVFFHNVSGMDGSAVLDGFTLSGGNADGSFPNNAGGGMYNSFSSPSIANCSFSGNSTSGVGGGAGGGMYSRSTSSPTLTNCSFSGNDTANGGGMYNSSSPIVTNCSFSGNNATGRGGGMYNSTSTFPAVTNCTFSGNDADDRGGGMYNFNTSSSLAVVNCSFSGNDATNGGGLYNRDSSPAVANCILWGNSSGIFDDNGSPTVTYSIVQGGVHRYGQPGRGPAFHQ